MIINQCDLCGQHVETKNCVAVGRLWRGAQLCLACARPIVDFLIEKNLLEQAHLEDMQTVEEKVS